jgi:hypothetical protein
MKHHNEKHGFATDKTAEYQTWRSMRQRCNNPAHPQFERYGGRGISICARWDDFSAFLADMGPKPDGFTIERVNNSGDYEPGNCIWATPSDQARNRRTTIMIGNVSLTELAEQHGVKRDTALKRYRKGLPLDRVLATSSA